MQQTGYSLIRLSDGAVLADYALGQGLYHLVFDGQAVWQMPGWQSSTHALVERWQNDLPSNKVPTGESEAFDGKQVNVTRTFGNPAPPPIPEIISSRQFFQQLAIQALCTEDEALTAVQIGILPTSLAALVSGLPANQQFAAKMLLTDATQFLRHHPLTSALAAAFGWTDAQTDALWTAAFQL